MRATPSPPSESRLTPLAADESPGCNLAAAPAGAHSFLAVMGKALLQTPQTARSANENATTSTSKPVPVVTGSRSLPVSIRAQTNEKSISAEPAGAVPEAVPIATTEGEGTPPPVCDQQVATTTLVSLAFTDSAQGPMPAEPDPDEDTGEPAADEKPLRPKTEPPVNPASPGPSPKVSLAKHPTFSESSTEVLITPPPVSRPDATGVQHEVRQPRSTADGPSVNSDESAVCPPGDIPPPQTADSHTPAPASESPPPPPLDAANPPSAPPPLPGTVCPIATAQNLDNPLGAGRGQVDPRGMGESSPTQIAGRPNTGLGQIWHEAGGSTGRRRTSLQTALKTAAPARSCSAETASSKTLSEPIDSGPKLPVPFGDAEGQPAPGQMIVIRSDSSIQASPPAPVIDTGATENHSASLLRSPSPKARRESFLAIPIAPGIPAQAKSELNDSSANTDQPQALVASGEVVWPRILSVAQLPASEPQPSSSAVPANTDWAPPAADQPRPFEPQDSKDVVRSSSPPVIAVESAAVANSSPNAPMSSPSPSPAAGLSLSGLSIHDAKDVVRFSSSRVIAVESAAVGNPGQNTSMSSPSPSPAAGPSLSELSIHDSKDVVRFS